MELERYGWMIRENHHPPASIDGTDGEALAPPASAAMHDVLRAEKKTDLVVGGVHQLQSTESKKKPAGCKVFLHFSHVRPMMRDIPTRKPS